MDLYSKAAELGVQTDFHDGHGQPHRTEPAALQIVLDSLPVQPKRRFFSGPIVLRPGYDVSTKLGGTAALPIDWTITGGTDRSGQTADAVIHWPGDLPPGLYRIRARDAEGATEDVPLIVAPARAFGGDFDRAWILAVQLYGVRSDRNWGIGDFTDLETLIRLAAELGAGGVGLNPLHALFDDRPADCSPYSPNSRLFLNPLYIDVGKLSGPSPDAARLRRLRDSATVDYSDVADLKWRTLRAAFESFSAAPDARDAAEFAAFRAERAPLLDRFACFEVLRHRFKTPWWEWPDEWQRPDDAKCATLRSSADADDVAFVAYVQWIADRQLRDCRELAADLKLPVGLYLDVAVGVQSDGFDAWNEQVAISRHLAVGAPPDPLNTAGQNWGLAGFNAVGLEAQSFAPFRDMLRASMRHAGAIRLDHVLGLQRLYLVPHGFAAKNGVYVQMPLEALLAVTAQESDANKCLVIGEDLGTVPDGFRDRLADWGIWSYRVMMFERDYHSGAFHGVSHYPSDALVTFNTHDLATFAGWRGMGDLTQKRALGMDPGESDDARRHALAMLSDVLRHNSIEQDDLTAVVRFLARTKSRLLAVSLEDLLNVVDQPNIPGTIDEHPNWRQRMPVAVDRIADTIDIPALRDATRERSSLS